MPAGMLGLKLGTPCGPGAVQPFAPGIYPPGPTNGYATPNGVTGFIGPAAGSLQQPTAWYVRATGNNLNGGTTTSTTASRTGTDGSTTSGSLTFTSASAAFTTADVGAGICIQNATRCYAKIVSLNSATSVQLSNPPSATAGSLSWSIGGAWATPEPFVNCNVYANTDCGVRSGDSVYVGAGVYRVVETVGTNWSTLWNLTGTTKLQAYGAFNGQVNIVGDVTGQFTGDPGMVQLTAYTTNDKTAPSTSSLLNLNGKSNLAFSNIMFVGGNATLCSANVLTSQNITFQDCAFEVGFTVGTGILNITCGYLVPLAWLFNRCYFVSSRTASGTLAGISCTTGVGSDYDINVSFLNCIAAGTSCSTQAINVTNSGTLANKGNGVRIRSSHFLFCGALVTAASQTSTIFPSYVYDSFMYGTSANAPLSAGTLGQIVEDYNLIAATTARTNVTAGANSVSDGSYAPLFHFGQERIWVGTQRPFGEPMSASPLLGFGNDGAQTAYDLYNRPRPAGGASGGGSSPLPAVGALERGNTAVQEISIIHTGSNAISIIGPGYQDYDLSVNAVTATIGVWCQFNASYTGPYPVIQVVKGLQAGVPNAQVSFDAGALNTWQQKTLVITPTASGIVTIRMWSMDQSGVAKTTFDTFSVA